MQLLYATFRVTYVIARDRSDLQLTNLKERGYRDAKFFDFCLMTLFCSVEMGVTV